MTTYYYNEVSATGYQRGPCSVCGKTAERQRTFTNTVNPFNKNEDGTVRTRSEVWKHVSALAREWQDGPVAHARCES